ncbi:MULTISPECIES: ABC transporter substrate-binding protein [unclassified Mesorhizobium]|uniref:ABC transporter substrate-binding protein n=1 Tax=unclassified Mesorhizobium TaxID=325217 RepID=UPI0010918989|nr:MULTISPECIES: ABC transporter substrate-binding protein [unclassified Mesorhizobium]TGQ01372.1 ABC transporter substrate-binding protein [Mesorhizobium sp. M8A.F.Ca.ET.218.01.1.1]TGT20643.1 ABC transporter substrate-binding protein [Mesorhizobium sp. M8A.F.Ca.ET.213.01.1.1]
MKSKSAGNRIRHMLMSTALIAAFATANAPAFADVVKIGLLAPITGPAAADGQEFQRGVQMAIDEANAAGGVAGNTFELVVGDVKDQSAGNVTSAVERLLGDPGVQFMLTGYASLTNFEIDNMAEAEMPYMLAATSQQTRDIIAPSPDKYMCCWSLTPSFDAYNTDVTLFVEKLAADGKITLPTKKVAIISSDNAYSKTISEGMKKTFKEKGWTITVDEIVPFGEVTDWRPILAKVRENVPDVVINTDYLPGNSASFLNQFLEQPTKSLVFLQYAPSVPEFVELTGKKSNAVIYNLLGGALTTPKNPRADEVAAKFKAKYGVESGTYGVGLYEMTNVYFDAVKKVGGASDHAAIMKALSETDKQVAEGRLKFDPATHLATQGDDYIPITFFQIWDGQRTLISPEKYATGAFKPQPWMQ